MPGFLCFTNVTHPTGNLDTENEENIAEILQSLAHGKDYVVIVVSHNPSIADLADVRMTMKDGKMIAIEKQ